jgi:two-component system C4-dicarboxylate transport response regulator DctD
LANRILIIDDDPAGLLALSEALHRRIAETTVETALDVHAALDLLNQKDFHVVLSDVRMAGLDGFTLLNQVRERWPEISVILMTGGGGERAKEALRHGAYAFIEKPINLDHMLPTVQAGFQRTALLSRVQEANRESQQHLDFEAGRMDLGFDPRVKKRPSS